MNKEIRQHYYDRVEEKIAGLPWYVAEFIDKRRRKLSPATLLNYCHDYLIFFDWIVAEQLFSGSRTEIPLGVLETMTAQEVESFLSFLEFKLGNSRLTVNRKLSALKSLFDYLQNKAETKELKPYIQRNVMAKMELNALKEDQETIANRIGGKILRNDEFELFRQFVAHDFGELNREHARIYHFHQINRERDTAIVSLILGSGLRLSEVAGCDLEDLDLKKSFVRVVRKGNKEQYVYFSEQAMRDLQDYLLIRQTRYKPEKSMRSIFLAARVGPKGKSGWLTPRSIEKLVEKYAAAFGKPSLTVHTLRHSFATRYHQENNDVPKLRTQLGHSSIQTTMIYTHLTNEELKEAIKKIDR